MDTEKRDRCTNFTFEDTELLVSLVEERKGVLECKKTDTITNKAKDLEWEKLAVSYNTKASDVRTAKMLRRKWEALKKTTRKEIAAVKEYRTGTGGGPSKKNKKNPWADRIVFILGIGALGTPNAFDSDRAAEGDEDHPPNNKDLADNAPFFLDLENVEYVMEDLYDQHSDSQQEVPSQWDKWNPATLKLPISESLKVSERRISNTPNSSSLDIEPDEDEPVSPSVNNSLSRRRPTLKKRKSSLTPAAETNKKFSALADSKLELVQLQIELAKKESEARMKMEAERHQLQMQILETELKIKKKLLH